MAIRIPIISDFQDRGLKAAEKGLAGLSKEALKSSVSIAAVATYLGNATKAAAEDEQSQMLLANALRNSARATSEQIDQVENSISKLQFQAAVADDELRPALGNLVRATGDVEKAQKYLSLALDISAGTGRSLESVSIALSKAANGQVTSLQRLGVPLDATAVKTKDVDAIMESLAVKFEGASDAAANTAQGGLKKLNIAFDELSETIGYQILPYLEQFTGIAIPALNGLNYATEQSANLFKENAKETGFWGKVLNKTVGTGALLFGGLPRLIAGAGKENKEFTGTTLDLQNATANLGKTYKDIVPPTSRLRELAEQYKENQKATGGAAEAVVNYGKKLMDALEPRLKSAKEKLIDAQKQFEDFAKSVSGNLTSGLGFKTAEEAGEETGAGYVAGLRTEAEKVKTFSELTNRLLTMGLSQDALQTVLSAGTDAGIKIAQELINGGTEAITGAEGINQLIASTKLLADQVGANAANEFYMQGVMNAQAYLDGLVAIIDSFNLDGIQTPKQLRRAKRTLKSQISALEAVPLKNGGIVKAKPGGTLALIGEGGRDEAVVPLSRNKSAFPTGAVTINVSGALDPVAVARQIQQILDNRQSAFGF
jgi:hypothetical protein